MERHERLRLARERHFATMKEAAESLGVPYGTYSGHENGSRGFKVEELLLYARRFQVSRAWLAFGDGGMFDAVSAGSSPDESKERELAGLPSTDRTTPPRDKIYIQAELGELHRLVSGALQSENIREEEADLFADAVIESLREKATISFVLRLEGDSRTETASPGREIVDQS